VCDEFRHPIGIITKGALVRRDVDLLARMAQRGGAHVAISIPFLDEDDARKIEPWASAPQTRLETIRRLAEAGVPTSVAVAPLIPAIEARLSDGVLANRARTDGRLRPAPHQLHCAAPIKCPSRSLLRRAGKAP
jgi:DNA repair photolyase